MRKKKVVLVGFGYWGPNLARNLYLNSEYDLLAVVDFDEERRKLANSLYGVHTFSSHFEIAKEFEFDLAIICTRPSSHKQIASYFIIKGINVLITKPCGINSAEANEIARLADRYKVHAFCDFTYHFSPLMKFLFEDIGAASIVKQLREFSSYRTSLGIIQSDIDVIADLAVHDIYILLLLKRQVPLYVNCIRANSLDSNQLRSALITLTWHDGFTASLHVSWNSLKKIRLIYMSSENQGIILEEMNREAPIQMIKFNASDSDYVKLSAEERKLRNVSFVLGNLEVPQIEMYEALKLEFEQIAQVLDGQIPPINLPCASDAVEVWKIVEALGRSHEGGGARIYV